MISEIDQRIDEVYHQWIDLQQPRVRLPLIDLIQAEIDRTEALHKKLMDLIKIRPGRYLLDFINFNILDHPGDDKGFTYMYEHQVGSNLFPVLLKSANIFVRVSDDEKQWVDVEEGRKPLLLVPRDVSIPIIARYECNHHNGVSFGYTSRLGEWRPKITKVPTHIRVPDRLTIQLPNPYISGLDQLPVSSETLVTG